MMAFPKYIKSSNVRSFHGTKFVVCSFTKLGFMRGLTYIHIHINYLWIHFIMAYMPTNDRDITVSTSGINPTLAL